MPGARCTRSPCALVESTRSSPRAHRDHPAFPHANGFNGFLRALPGDEFLFATVASRIEGLHRTRLGRSKPPRDLTPATGARTTRLRRPQQRRSSRALRSLTGCEARPAISSNAHDIVASTASHPNVRDDRDTPLVRDETAESIRLIWVFSEAEYFSREGWTEKSGTQVICLSGTSGAFLLLAISVLMTVYAISWFKPQQVP